MAIGAADASNALGNVFQGLLSGNGEGAQAILSGAGEGGLGIGGGAIAEIASDQIMKTAPGKALSKVTSAITGGVVDGEAIGDIAKVVVDVKTGNIPGVITGAIDLLDNFKNFDISKTGPEGLAGLTKPTQKLYNKALEKSKLLSKANELKHGIAGQTAKKAIEGIGQSASKIKNLAPSIVGLATGEGAGGKLQEVLGGAENLQGMADVLKPISEMGSALVGEKLGNIAQ